ncbi:hypothetical protein [Pseudomonas asplenii]|uniref:hypothetical protein n=1 Tax=Pseudomonas asplenii TaxID=53407 RepID=UPI0012FB302E|nr:hypothetical protein [Pseudomonas fuscovaginae]
MTIKKHKKADSKYSQQENSKKRTTPAKERLPKHGNLPTSEKPGNWTTCFLLASKYFCR